MPEPAFPVNIPAAVDRDGGKPGFDIGVSPELVQLSVSLDERFLHSVFCQGLVMQVGETEAQQRKLVLFHQACDLFIRRTARALYRFHGTAFPLSPF